MAIQFLMKMTIKKDDEVIEKHNEIWEQLKIVSKTNLIANDYVMKNIEKLK